MAISMIFCVFGRLCSVRHLGIDKVTMRDKAVGGSAMYMLGNVFLNDSQTSSPEQRRGIALVPRLIALAGHG